MAAYFVMNQTGKAKSWQQVGMWLIGSNDHRRVIDLHLSSQDHGNTLEGTITYEGDPPVILRAEATYGNVYRVSRCLSKVSEEVTFSGTWMIGKRGNQRLVQVDISSPDRGESLMGTLCYDGEPPTRMKSKMVVGFGQTHRKPLGLEFA